MGGEVLLLMEKGETRKVRLFLETICEKIDGVLWLKGPKIEGYRNEAGCWIGFKRNIIEVGYSMHEFSIKWADAVGCGIRDHFKIRKGGWDCIGYSDDFMTTRPWKVNMELTERTLRKKPLNKLIQGMYGKTLADDIAIYKEFQKIYEDRVNELFSGVHKTQ